MRRNSDLGKVVIQTRDKKIYRGFSKSEFISESNVKIIDAKGDQREMPLESLKAVFFVRDFDGNPEYDVVRFLNPNTKNPRWIIAEVHFKDGEVVEGRVRNNFEFLNDPGFYLWPSDEIGNTELMYLVKEAVKGFRIIGLR